MKETVWKTQAPYTMRKIQATSRVTVTETDEVSCENFILSLSLSIYSDTLITMSFWSPSGCQVSNLHHLSLAPLHFILGKITGTVPLLKLNNGPVLSWSYLHLGILFLLF
ncbi:MAG: hypothetical protein ACK5L8_12395, partial [Marinicella pacifica]